ncbi:MAG TPA: polysaccharide biosynthesis tyrosine autokinase [Ignavibacteriaceae bacterium]|nr:polysaccharide biosynthesis tyrosine autokinase [Ignavibacteriaceae bacterium]
MSKEKNPQLRSTRPKRKEKSLVDLFQILNKHKWYLIISVVLALIIAILYNFVSTPIYEATVLLKKENAPEASMKPDIQDILNIQNQDIIETEMELVQTWTVLRKVADSLNLFLTIDKIVKPSGESIEIAKNAIEYESPEFYLNSPNLGSLPEFGRIKIEQLDITAKFYVKVNSQTNFSLYSAENDRLLETTSDSLTGNFTIDIAKIPLKWSNAEPGSKVYFTLDNYYSVIEGLKKSLSVQRRLKTDVFEVSIKNSSPFAAAKISNVLTDKFRESRIDQQKETIRYSFNFVDQQLEQMQEKLKSAEANLTSFKSSGQIMTIDKSSEELVNFLSSLEAEKMKTELELGQYKNKMADMQKELGNKGYFDQSFLAPEGNEPTNSPFSSAMKQLSDLELQRLELLQKRTESHPDVIKLDEQINLVKNKLGSFNENTLTSYGIISNALEQKLLQITNLMSKYEVKMETLPAQENRLVSLMRQKNVYEKIFTLLLDKREEMRMAELSKLQDIVIVDPAHTPLDPISPKKLLNLILALIAGAFIGVMSIFILEFKNTKLINLDELEEDFKIPILAIVPAYTTEIKSKIENAQDGKSRLVTLMENADGFTESFRLLKTKILFQMEGKEKIFLVTSCEENTGKTSVVSNLAVSIAQENKRVLVIDCDLRKAELSSKFDISEKSPGLIEYLMNDVPPKIYNKILKRIDILPAGGTTEDSGNILNSEKMKLLFETINSSAYDFIIIDTPPVTRVVDTLILGRFVKDAILVVRPGFSFKESVYGGIQDMMQASIKIRGIVVNSADVEKSSYRYRYGYGYGYGHKKYGETSKQTIQTGEVVESKA